MFHAAVFKMKTRMYFLTIVIMTIVVFNVQAEENVTSTTPESTTEVTSTTPVPTTEITSTTPKPTTEFTSTTSKPTTELPPGCVCGIFLSGQFKKNNREPPKGYPALLHEHPDTFPCTAVGTKLCTNKCLDAIVKHLPNSPAILCASIDRDCHKERAYLFVKNCKDQWINTNLSAGREYCCKDGMPYKCPMLK